MFDGIIAMDGDILGHNPVMRLRYRWNAEKKKYGLTVKLLMDDLFLEKFQITKEDVSVTDNLAGLDLFFLGFISNSLSI